MTMTELDEEAVRKEIVELRAIGTASALKVADELEVSIVTERRKVKKEIGEDTVRHLGDVTEPIITEIKARGIDMHDLGKWPAGTRRALFEALQHAHSAAQFMTSGTAHLMRVTPGTIDVWLQSDEWDTFIRDKNRRVGPVASLVDMTIKRMAQIMSLETKDDMDILRLQAQVGRTILTSGVQVTDRMKGKEKKDRAERTLPKPTAATVPAVAAARVVVPK